MSHPTRRSVYQYSVGHYSVQTKFCYIRPLKAKKLTNNKMEPIEAMEFFRSCKIFASNGAQLTFRFLDFLTAGGEAKENVFFSPFSVRLCAALACAGADGDTANEITNHLQLVSIDKTVFSRIIKSVLQAYMHESDVVQVASKIYVQEGKQLKDVYKSLIHDFYFAENETLDFGDSAAAAESINSWIAAKTAGKIEQLVTPDCFTSLTRIVLLNALHFKADWAQKFDADGTVEDDFWIGEEQSVKVQYMNQKAKFGYGYFEELDCTALEMPYKDSELKMFVLLPNERTGLKDLLKKLQDPYMHLARLGKELNEEEVYVKFPKFKVDYSVELSNTFKQLGIKKMFSDDAEFPHMLESAEDVSVSSILHKACIEVNEEGTEAAAATGMIMATRMMLMPLQFQADRPFIYVIWNKQSVLFAGTFVDAPKA